MLKEKPLFIRADSSRRIGTGHVMRSLAIADRWREIVKGRVYFLGSIEEQTLINHIEERGVAYVSLEPQQNLEDDRLAVQKQLGGFPGSWLVVDGYQFDAGYLSRLREGGNLVLYIDDFTQPAFCKSASLLLNQHQAFRTVYSPQCKSEQLLLGPKFVLLREEFHLAKKNHKKRRRTDALKILVTMGGSDPNKSIFDVLDGLALLGDELEVKVIAGPANPWGKQIRERFLSMPCACELIASTTEMPGIMSWADFAITAGGGTCYELAYLGVPMAVIVQAENQQQLVGSLEQAGAVVNLGWHHEMSGKKIADMLRPVFDDDQLQNNMAQKGRQFIDGHGADRVVKRMLTWQFELRAAEPDDCRILYDWHKDPQTRSNSLTTQTVSYNAHVQWFHNRLADEKVCILLGVDCLEDAFGVVRFEPVQGQYRISVSIAPAYRGCGLGALLIRKGCERFLAEVGNTAILATIKKENVPSKKAFESAGFTPAGSAVEHGQDLLYFAYGG